MRWISMAMGRPKCVFNGVRGRVEEECVVWCGKVVGVRGRAGEGGDEIGTKWEVEEAELAPLE